jgi:hypothetical protein
MHKKKEGVIPRILVKESLNLELWLKCYEGLKFQGLFCKFLEKNWKLDFPELFFDGKICGLSPRGCGPRRPGPPWTGSHCRVPELIEARPPAASVAEVAGRGAEEGKGSTGSQFSAHRGSEGGGGESFVPGRLRLRNGAKRSGGGGEASVPFYRVGGGAGQPGGGGGAP